MIFGKLLHFLLTKLEALVSKLRRFPKKFGKLSMVFWRRTTKFWELPRNLTKFRTRPGRFPGNSENLPENFLETMMSFPGSSRRSRRSFGRITRKLGELPPRSLENYPRFWGNTQEIRKTSHKILRSSQELLWMSRKLPRFLLREFKALTPKLKKIPTRNFQWINGNFQGSFLETVLSFPRILRNFREQLLESFAESVGKSPRSSESNPKGFGNYPRSFESFNWYSGSFFIFCKLRRWKFEKLFYEVLKTSHEVVRASPEAREVRSKFGEIPRQLGELLRHLEDRPKHLTNSLKNSKKLSRKFKELLIKVEGSERTSQKAKRFLNCLRIWYSFQELSRIFGGFSEKFRKLLKKFEKVTRKFELLARRFC